MRDLLPLLKTKIPGPKSRALSRQLHRYESRNVTFVSRDWPIFWERASGANVWDADGNRYVDLTAGFGVAGVGHSNPRVAAALKSQASKLIHTMGDVHPNELKLRLARELVGLTFQRWRGRSAKAKSSARVLFANSGAEAVEAALKTAVIHTKRAGVISFEGAYHGLTYGALDATWRTDFRSPFSQQLGHFTAHFPYGRIPDVSHIEKFGAVIVEPIQGRGGVNVPTEDFLGNLRGFCDQYGLLLIFDEIYTGFCRTGRWFACEHWDVIPDIVCVGKAMTGGFPMAACVARAEVMDSWPESEGEAIHTSTFLGNPLGSAAALASIGEMKRRKLDARSAKLGDYLVSGLQQVARKSASITEIRGKGLMIGMEFSDASLPVKLSQELLRRGVIVLPDGNRGEVLGITPPLIITQRQLDYCVDAISDLIE